MDQDIYRDALHAQFSATVIGLALRLAEMVEEVKGDGPELVAGHPAPKRKPKPKQAHAHTEVLDGVRALGLTMVTAAQVAHQYLDDNPGDLVGLAQILGHENLNATAEPAPRPKKKPKRRWPKLPVPAGKAHQMLSSAIICGDHEQASWIDQAVKLGMVTGKPSLVRELRKRLDDVMEPLGRDQ